MTQEPSAAATSSAPDQVPESTPRPEQLVSKQKEPATGSTWRTVYNQLHEERPQTLQAATLLARRACQAADPPCSITFRTKRAVQESGCTGYKLWGSCAECRPACDLKARATIWLSGAAEGKVTVDCRGEHARKDLGAGGRLLAAGVANVVSKLVDSKTPITSRNIRDAVGREDLELGCEPKQLHSLVKRLRQQHGAASKVTPVPIQAFKDEATKWESHLPDNLQNLSPEDLARLFVLRSGRGSEIHEGRVYVPMSCAGMLMRLQDAAKHRIRLIVDMKMGAIANNYGVVTLCFAATSPSFVNTTAARLGGKRQQYMARPCTAQPVMQAIVSSEGEENLTACFEDLVWLCKLSWQFRLEEATRSGPS